MPRRSFARVALLALVALVAVAPSCGRSRGQGRGVVGITATCGMLSDPARNTVYVGDSIQGRVVALSATDGDPVRDVLLGNTIGGMALDHCARQLYVTVTGGRRIDVLDADTFTRTAVLRLGTPTFAIAPGRDGHLLVVTLRGLLDLDLATLKSTVLKSGVHHESKLCADRFAKRAWLVESSNGEIVVTAFDLENPGAPPVATGPGALQGAAIGVAVSYAGDRLYVGTDGAAGVAVLDGVTLAQLATIDVGPSLTAIAANTTGTRMQFAHGGTLVQSVNLDTFAAGRDVVAGGDVGECGLHVAPNNLALVVNDRDANLSSHLLFDLRIDAPTAVRQGERYTLALEGTPGAPWYLFVSLAPGYFYVDAPTATDPRFFDLSLPDGFAVLDFGRFDFAGRAFITGVIPSDFAATTEFVIQAAEVPKPGKAFIEIGNPMVVRFLGDDCN
jgi:DNA-binding beta-propeller fold protein YncE